MSMHQRPTETIRLRVIDGRIEVYCTAPDPVVLGSVADGTPLLDIAVAVERHLAVCPSTDGDLTHHARS